MHEIHFHPGLHIICLILHALNLMYDIHSQGLQHLYSLQNYVHLCDTVTTKTLQEAHIYGVCLSVIV